MAKAMVDQFPKYKDSAPGIAGFALDRQNFTWVIPYHEGAIRYFKEKGKWSAEAQAHNDKLVERQEVLTKAWAELKAKKPAGAEFKNEWRKVRAAALKRSEEHTSELQSLMRISYAVFCLQKTNTLTQHNHNQLER